MTIADEEGKFYTINDPETFLTSVDNDTMIEILKVTYNAKLTYDGIIGLLDKDIIVEVSNDSDDRTTAKELSEGVAFIKAHLNSVLSPEVVTDSLNEVEIALYGRTLTDEER